MKNLPLLLVTILGTVALVVGIAAFFSQPQTVDVSQVMGDARLAKGPQDAPVTIVEF